jgi:hypothetical protein
MFKKVVSIALMLERSGKNLRIDKLELDRESEINLAENLARLEVLLS